MHQREEIAADLAAVGVAGEDLLRIAGVDGEFPLAGVVAGATERAVEPHLAAGAVDLER